ncbi:hypothetical protein K3495_g9401 [Podosphaera aphanis]|nr:hypothetical protein K3495_g9401 [Podosphaera aphanis]
MESIQRYLTPVIGVIGSISRIMNVEDGMRWVFNRGRSGYHTRNTSDNCARCSRRLRKLNDDDKGQTHENLAADQFYSSHQKHYRLRGGAGHGNTAPTNQQIHRQTNGTNVHFPWPEEITYIFRYFERALGQIRYANLSVRQKLGLLKDAIDQHRLMFTFNEDELELPVNDQQVELVKMIEELKTEIVITLKVMIRMVSRRVSRELPIFVQNLMRPLLLSWLPLEYDIMGGRKIVNFQRIYQDLVGDQFRLTYLFENFTLRNRGIAHYLVLLANNSLSLVEASLDLLYSLSTFIAIGFNFLIPDHAELRHNTEQILNAESTDNNEQIPHGEWTDDNEQIMFGEWTNDIQ